MRKLCLGLAIGLMSISTSFANNLPNQCPELGNYDKENWLFDKTIATNSLKTDGKFLTAMWLSSPTGGKEGYIICKYSAQNGQLSFLRGNFPIVKPSNRHWEMSGEQIWNCYSPNNAKSCLFN